MEEIRFDVNNTQIQMVMVIKLNQLKRVSLPTLTYGNLEDFLMEKLWVKSFPKSLHEATDEILHIEANDIVKFLSKKAIQDGSRMKLSDFSDVIGG